MRTHFDTPTHYRSREEDPCSAASLVEDAVYNATSYPHLEEEGGFYDESAEGEDFPERDADAEAIRALFSKRRRPARKARAGKIS